MDNIKIYPDSARLPLRQLIIAIDVCLEKELFMPGLILLYSTIDIMAAINSISIRAGRKAFVEWVDEYLLPESGLACSAADLYGGRCSLIHTLSPESNLSRKGKAKEIAYIAKTKPEDKLDKRITGPVNTVIVDVEKLLVAFRKATLRFMNDVLKDPIKKRAWRIFILGSRAT